MDLDRMCSCRYTREAHLIGVANVAELRTVASANVGARGAIRGVGDVGVVEEDLHSIDARATCRRGIQRPAREAHAAGGATAGARRVDRAEWPRRDGDDRDRAE